jgi:phosphatidylinositol alpha-mannosyltransferase
VPLRIAIVTQAYRPAVGGVTEHVDATARELRARGHHVAVITSNFSADGDGAESDPEGPGDGAPDVIRIGRNLVVPFNGAENNLTIGFGLAGRLRRALDRGGYDVAHVHCPLSPTLPLLTLRHATMPIVGTFHTASSSDFLFRMLRRPLRGFYGRMKRVVAVSDAAREEVMRHFPGPVAVVPNGVDLARFRPGLKRLERYDDGTPNILFVGRFDPRKGLPDLMLACAILAREGLPFRLILAGDGRLRGTVERMAAGALEGRVHFEGRVRHDRLPRYYATADVFCSPALGSESFGLVLLEAMATGAPVVATDIPGYRCVVTHGVDGLLLPPRDPAALALALRALLLDPARRAAFGNRGVATASRYGWDRIARNLEGVYAEALGLSPVAAPADAPVESPLPSVAV